MPGANPSQGGGCFGGGPLAPGARRAVGRIVRFERNFGFIKSPTEADDVFFLPSALPAELQDLRTDDILNKEVEVEVTINEKGKPRASRIAMLGVRQQRMAFGGPPPGPPPPPFMRPPMGHGPPMGPPMMLPPGMAMGPMGMPMGMGPMGPMGPMGMPMPPMVPGMMHMGPPMGPPRGPIVPGPLPGPPPGADGRAIDPSRMRAGKIVNYDVNKGFGFIAVEGLGEDVFVARNELPPELRDLTNKDAVVGQLVEFEMKEMPDGKLRAKRVFLLMMHQMMPGPPPALPPPPARHHNGAAQQGRVFGEILRYDKAKGYGFIVTAALAEDVFFLRSALPKERQDPEGDELKGLRVAFDLRINEEGKPRAGHIEFTSEDRAGHAASSRGGGAEPRRLNIQPGEVLRGVIARFQPKKGYGFVSPDEIDEDVFFLRSEMPPEISGPQRRKEEIVRARVEFEVRVMPDGKLRAQRMVLLEHPPAVGEGDPAMDGDGDGEPNEVEDGEGEMEGDGEPEVADVEEEEEAPMDMPEGEPGPEAEPAELEDQDEGGEPPAGALEPSIIPSAGCQPSGWIRQYDAQKGFGFLSVDGLGEDVFFPRMSLPEAFQKKRRKDMPELVGAEVTFELDPKEDRGPRARRVTLVLRWHADGDDRCWLLKRRE